MNEYKPFIFQANDDKTDRLFLNQALEELKLTTRKAVVEGDDQHMDLLTCKVDRLALVLFPDQNSIFSFHNHSERSRTIQPYNENILFSKFRTIQL